MNRPSDSKMNGARLSTPFKHVPDYGDGIDSSVLHHICEAEFELPNDGTPDTRNVLVVSVSWEPSSEQAQVTLTSRTYTDKRRDKQIITESVHIERLSGLLFGYATLQTQQVLVPK